MDLLNMLLLLLLLCFTRQGSLVKGKHVTTQPENIQPVVTWFTSMPRAVIIQFIYPFPGSRFTISF
jgi:hypothetical protein